MRSRNKPFRLPLSLPEAPYLGAVVQTEEGIVQLIMVEKLRESVLRQAFFEQTVSPAESFAEDR